MIFACSQLSHPAPHQYQQPPEYQRPPPPFLHANVPTNKHQQQPPQLQQHSNGFIMVDPMQKHTQTSSLNGDASKKSKAKKKKNKKTGDASLDTASATTTSNQNQNKIVTLRNPLFQSVVPGAHDGRGGAIPAHSAFHRGQMPPMNVNQHASITKNDNGMFTIRNPALHPQFTSTVSPQYRPYAPELFPHEVKNDNFSYFSENAGRQYVTPICHN